MENLVENILDFIEMIVEFFEMIFEFITTFIESLMTAFAVIASAITMPAAISGLVPQILLTSMLTLFSLAVVKFIVGR